MRASPIGDNGGGGGGNYSHGFLYKHYKGILVIPCSCMTASKKLRPCSRRNMQAVPVWMIVAYVYIYTYRVYNWQRWSFICIRWMYRYEDIIRNTYVCTYILVLYICINILHTEYICTDRIVNSIWSYAFYSRSRDKITHD